VLSPASSEPRSSADAEAELVRARSSTAPARSAEALLQELQVHQIELQMQNEALRQAQAALEESRDRYLDLFEFAPIGYLTLDNAGQISEINLTGAVLLGADRGQLLQRSFALLVAPEDRDMWHKHRLHALQHGGKQSCELNLRHGNGESFAACLDCLRTAGGDALPTLRIALTDISERKAAERKLRAMAQFPEENPLPVLRLSGTGSLLYANLPGRRFFDLLGGADDKTPPVLRALADSALRENAVVETEIVDLRGYAFWVGAVRPAGESYVNVYARDISARWHAERALQESEVRFRTMADAAPVLIWIAGVDKACTWFNQQWLKFTGRTMAQELGAGWTESVHADDLDRCLRTYHHAFDRRHPFEIEYRLRRADGNYRWVLGNGVPRYGADKEFLGYIGSCFDITRMKHVADDLNRAQSVGQLGSWRFDVERGHFKGSRETRRIFGVRDGASLSYEAFLAKIHPDDRQAVDRMWHDGTQRQPYDVEHRLVIDGAVKWVREKAELEFDAQGQLRSAFGITQDITQLKETRQALVESQERFHVFMTHSPVASWIVDVDGRFQYVSPTHYEMIGLATGNLVGKSIRELYPPALADKYLSNNQAAIDAWQPIKTVEPGLLADGSQGEYLVVKFPIRDAGGQVLVCGMALDITERQQSVAQLRDANERLERLAVEQAAHLRELARNLTHAEQRERDHLYELLHDEMQPLLVAARLSLSGLGMHLPPDDWLKVAAEATGHISRVIAVARTLSLQLSPPLLRERGLNPALESLCRWVRDNHGLQVDLSSAPEAESDDMALRLLCFNAVRELLMNVVKHAGAARVALTLQLVDSDTLRITVADGGTGFDPSTNTGGSGLSAIERRLGMLGGSLRIDSRPGRGTVATLLAPLRRATAAGRRSARGGRHPENDGGQDAQDTDRG
jgi:PAS domain S-box-containing protein